MQTPGNIKEAIPFFEVIDIEASLRFYVDGLGFSITQKWMPDGRIRWCCLQRDGGTLMLQELVNEAIAAKQKEGKFGVGVSIVFTCEDALAIYEETKANGIDVSEPFVGNNMWVISVKDPDGYHIDFESATTVPEGTMYSDWKSLHT